MLCNDLSQNAHTHISTQMKKQHPDEETEHDQLPEPFPAPISHTRVGTILTPNNIV